MRRILLTFRINIRFAFLFTFHVNFSIRYFALCVHDVSQNSLEQNQCQWFGEALTLPYSIYLRYNKCEF